MDSGLTVSASTQSLFPIRLDPHETNGQFRHSPFASPPSPGVSAYDTFRHGFWRRLRLRTHHALVAAFILNATINRFWHCGAHAKVYRHRTDPGRYQVRSFKCRNRWCVPCAKDRGFALAQTLSDLIGPRTVRMITLTIRTTDESLELALNHLYKSFSRLRRTPLWKATQNGGAVLTEVKWNPFTNRWHPHLHILSEGTYIPKHQLVEAWRQASRGSFIVDIRLVRNREELCRYVTKYLTKPVTQNVTLNQPRFAEAIAALNGRRLCTTYGTWRGQLLTRRPDADEWELVDTFASLHHQATADPTGDAAVILACLTQTKQSAGPAELPRGPPNETRTSLHYDYRPLD